MPSDIAPSARMLPGSGRTKSHARLGCDILDPHTADDPAQIARDARG